MQTWKYWLRHGTNVVMLTANWRWGPQACVGAPLGRAVMFSSIAALTGPAGSANYAAANAALDSLCHSQRSQGVNPAARSSLDLTAS